jgi:3-phenylpropionate/cinnamic acid dioxygenase small subunit
LPTIEERLRLLEDERQIVRTLYQYAHALDYGELSLFLDCFQSDAVYHTSSRGTFHGHGEITTFFNGHTHAPAHYHKHLVTNPTIEIAGEQAAVTSYFVFSRTASNGPYLKNFGRYDDQLTRCTDGSWRFLTRRIHVEAIAPDDLTGP